MVKLRKHLTTIIWPMFATLLLLYYGSINLNFIVLIIIISYYYIRNKFIITLDFPGAAFYVLEMTICFITGLFNTSSLYIFLKQICYYLLPCLFWIYSDAICSLYDGDNIRKRIVSTIYWAAFVYSVMDLVKIIPILLANSFSNVYYLREAIGNGSTLPVIGIYLLLVYKNELKIKNKVFLISLFIFFAPLILHFSRINIICLIILLAFSGIFKNIKRIMKYAIATIFTLLLLNQFAPTLFNSFLDKIARTFIEIGSSNENWTLQHIVQDWRGYEISCAKKKFLGYNLLQQIIGTGFGTTLDVQGYAYLVTTENNLSFLHNGYYTQLLLGGILGVILYIGWMISIFLSSNKVNNKKDKQFIRGLAISMMITAYVVMGPLFSAGQAIFLLYVGLFDKLEKKSKCSIANSI